MATRAEAPAFAAAGLALASFASGSGGVTGRGKDSQHRNAKPRTFQNKTLSEDHREHLSTRQAQISEKDSLPWSQPSMVADQQVGKGQSAATDSSNEGAADHFKLKATSVPSPVCT